MNDRQKEILSAVVKEYTDTAVPVSSKLLVDKYHFGVSPATVRNDMNELEAEGLLYQPHTSAGRIPTDKGYRYFVEVVMQDRELPRKDQLKLQEEVLKLKAKNQRMSHTMAKLLGTLTGNLAISGVIEKDEFFDFGMTELLEEPEFRDLDEVCRIAEVLDHLDEKFDQLTNELHGETRIFIGKENPIAEISNCAMVVAPYKTKSGERGILALIGPKRMQYAKNKSLVEYVKKLLGTVGVVVVVFSI